MEIERLEFLPANVAKLRAHGISQAEVQSMVALDEWVVSGHDDYPGQLRVIGPTAAGRLVTVTMDPTGDPAVWRPITGWEATPSEQAYYWEQSL